MNFGFSIKVLGCDVTKADIKPRLYVNPIFLEFIGSKFRVGYTRGYTRGYNRNLLEPLPDVFWSGIPDFFGSVFISGIGYRL